MIKIWNEFIATMIDLLVAAILFAMIIPYYINLFIVLDTFDFAHRVTLNAQFVQLGINLTCFAFFIFCRLMRLSFGLSLFHLSIRDTRTNQFPNKIKVAVRSLLGIFSLFDIIYLILTRPNAVRLVDQISGTKIESNSNQGIDLYSNKKRFMIFFFIVLIVRFMAIKLYLFQMFNNIVLVATFLISNALMCFFISKIFSYVRKIKLFIVVYITFTAIIAISLLLFNT